MIYIPGLNIRAKERLEDKLILFDLIKNHPLQQREILEFHDTLNQFAQRRAVELIGNHHLKHINPDGFGPNYLLREMGYELPDYYDQSETGNNIESFAYGYANVYDAWNGLYGSWPHVLHLLAYNFWDEKKSQFYKEQKYIGIGHVERFYRFNIYVLILAP